MVKLTKLILLGLIQLTVVTASKHGHHTRSAKKHNSTQVPDPKNCPPEDTCNRKDCMGFNNWPGPGLGTCQAPKCQGLPCKPSCPTKPPHCQSKLCKGMPSPLDPHTWICSHKKSPGCECHPSCRNMKDQHSVSKNSTRFCDTCHGVNGPTADVFGLCGPPPVPKGKHKARPKELKHVGCKCTSICGLGGPIPCAREDCNGVLKDEIGNGMCMAGAYRGCNCFMKCAATTLMTCSNWECLGINREDGPGVCQTQKYRGCSCISECKTFGSCSDLDCVGLNDPDGLTGTCTVQPYKGCPCPSVCDAGKDTRTCDSCGGINAAEVGAPGMCLMGTHKGCPCLSVCPKTPVDCQDSKCGGFGGLCMEGAMVGCKCTGGLTMPQSDGLSDEQEGPESDGDPDGEE